MDGITGVVLRDSFKSEDDTHQLVREVDHVVLDMRFGGKSSNKSPITPLYRVEQLYRSIPELPSKKTAVFVPGAYKAMSPELRIANALHEDFLHLHPSDLLYVEVLPTLDNEFELTRTFVTELLSLRHDLQIGIVSGAASFTGDTFKDRFTELISVDQRLFPCPVFVGAGLLEVEGPLEASARELPRPVPFFLSLSADDSLKLPEYLARNSGFFGGIVFWNSASARGVDIQALKEVLMGKRRKSVETKTVQVGIIDGVKRYRAKQPVARRESPSKLSFVKGTVTVDDPYEIGNIQDGTMGIQFGQIVEDGSWVVLKEGELSYFEEITL